MGSGVRERQPLALQLRDAPMLARRVVDAVKSSATSICNRADADDAIEALRPSAEE